MTVTDDRLFVPEAALVRADGSLAPITLEQDGQWQYDNVALLDFEDGSANCSATGNAPTNTTGMFWTWQDGFRFMQINPAPAMEMGGDAMAEAKPAGDGMGAMDMRNGWFLHLGSTQCAANAQTEIPAAIRT